MSRQVDPLMSAALSTGQIIPVILVMLTFRSGTRYIWSGYGDLEYNAQIYKGVGALGSVSTITEGTEVQSSGTSVGLSGIDPVQLNECLNDIQLGAPAKIWFGLMANGMTLMGAPYLIFSGTVDKPQISVGVEKIGIALALSTRMIDLQRASQRRYTAAEQHLKYPDDIGFNWVEILNDIALNWSN